MGDSCNLDLAAGDHLSLAVNSHFRSINFFSHLTTTLMAPVIPPSWIWKVTYKTSKDLDQGHD